MVDDFPLSIVLTQVPGVGAKIAEDMLLAAGDSASFPTPGTADYAGIAPVTRRSGTSIRGDNPARSGNKRLKNGPVPLRLRRLLPCPQSRAYYQRKIAEKKKLGRRHHVPRPQTPERPIRQDQER